MESMTTARHQLPSVTVIKVCEELDVLTAEALQERSRDVCDPGDHVVFDLTETTFMDCSGVRALLRVHEYVSPNGGSVHLSSPRPGPAKIIAITHVDRCLPTHASLEEAVRTGLAVAEANAHR
jgi:anti-sigma B factor antagonist